MTPQFFRFLVAGGIAALANILSRMLFSAYMDLAAAVVLAYCVGMAVAFVLMRAQVFPRSEARLVRQVAIFVGVNLAAVLQTLLTQIKKISAAVEHAVAQLQAGQILMSFPRAGKINAAQILAELGDDPQRFLSEDQLAAEAGIAPVTHESGKSRGVCFRYACNKRLRQALTCFADNSRHDSAWAFQVYAKARARGCDHPHAIRILARAWVRVLWRCWQVGSTYDPARHRAALPFLQSSAPTPSQA